MHGLMVILEVHKAQGLQCFTGALDGGPTPLTGHLIGPKFAQHGGMLTPSHRRHP